MTGGQLAPSIIAADYARFGDQLRAVDPFAARWHVDIMDGHYVPNLTIGPDFVRTIASVSSHPQDVHLMVANPGQTWKWYADAGAGRVAFHPDACDDPAALLREIASEGCGPGLAINPDVPASAAEPYIDIVDHLVVMSVFPGFSGQRFIESSLDTLRDLRAMVDASGRKVQLICDGGVTAETGRQCMKAGADVLVAASAIFGAADPAGAAAELAGVAGGDVR